jgi:hypothetical protein
MTTNNNKITIMMTIMKLMIMISNIVQYNNNKHKNVKFSLCLTTTYNYYHHFCILLAMLRVFSLKEKENFR